MKLYLECNMGAAGDMLMAALYELLPEPEAFLDKMRSLGLPGIEIFAEKSVKCGITGTHMRVTARGTEETQETDAEPTHNHDTHNHDTHAHGHSHDHGHTHDHTHNHTHTHDHNHTHDHEHEHTHDHGLTYPEILRIIKALPLPERVISDALAVYALLAEAESEVHGVQIEQVHFHEVGALDALADIVGVCLLIDMLGVTDISASPVHVGTGFVRCAHGLLPVPAPATALLLRDIPIYGGAVRGELCTPTGAALLRRFVSRFGDMAPMKTAKIGYGMGTRDLERCNCVRAFLSSPESPDGARDEIAELRCNLDDMTGEEIGFAAEALTDAGALDVFLTPVYMKKNRPATLFTVLCRTEDKEKFTQLIFKYTTTLGVRYETPGRAILTRTEATRETSLGAVRVKRSEGYGVAREKAEYDDIARLARENGIAPRDVR
ncbi:MAG: nickel pincer cofactor biosynthesis protein LarC [Oscillospiraceae bacterium]|jgi:uncharacterized protein (TIGR00299 family) protein|nr:nickel pincer cofactor biosynthesis protein LarC [Oscillospiraceae bacterium]